MYPFRWRARPDRQTGATSSAVPSDDLFSSCHERIYRYVRTFTRDPAEAEDLTQETFLRAYRREETLRDPRAAVGWLYRIATNVCLDRLRQRRPDFLDEDSGPARIASATPSPLARLERGATSACVQHCLEWLSDSYRAVLLLHDAYGLTAREIAALLGVSLPTVKIRLHRARGRLREVMASGCRVSDGDDGLPCCEPKNDDRIPPRE